MFLNEINSFQYLLHSRPLRPDLTPYAHTQAPAQILFNAFLPKQSHRVGTLKLMIKTKDIFARRNELERQREGTV